MQRVLDKATDGSLLTRFEALNEFLSAVKLSKLSEVNQALKDAQKLAKDLRDLMSLGFTSGEIRAAFEACLKSIE